MKVSFVQTDNVKKFLIASSAVEERTATEAKFVLVTGDAGFGKTETCQWWGVRREAVFVRVKAAATPHWFLTDLVRELGEEPAAKTEQLFAQSYGLLARKQCPIVIDEVENAIGANVKVLDTLRDLVDPLEITVVLCGREHVKPVLRRKREVWTRISGVAEFGPLTAEDVAKVCGELAEVPIGADVVAEIARQSEGYIREVIKAIGNVERIGRKQRGKTVTMEEVGQQTLIHEWQRRGGASMTEQVRAKGARGGKAATGAAA
ncbi:MAG: AAA family ATPase [Desulfobulbaceae bacterium]|nr:MAG: AAA family ATPase [Desulfobulbaceae bacterium]